MAAIKLKDLPVEKRGELTDQILERYRAGEEIKKLAPAYHLSAASIYELLLRTCPEEYRAAQSARALSRLEDARKGLEQSTNQVDAGKYERLCKIAQWELEKLAGAIYRQGEQQTGAQQIFINIGIDRSKPVTIEQESH